MVTIKKGTRVKKVIPDEAEAYIALGWSRVVNSDVKTKPKAKHEDKQDGS